MQALTLTQGSVIDKAESAKGVSIAARILSKWAFSYEEGCAVLQVSRSIYAKALGGQLKEVKITKDQATRIGLVLNIHAAIRTLFENPENVQGFVSMPNNNPFFNGKSPRELITTGNFIALYETARRIDSLRGAQW